MNSADERVKTCPVIVLLLQQFLPWAWKTRPQTHWGAHLLDSKRSPRICFWNFFNLKIVLYLCLFKEGKTHCSKQTDGHAIEKRKFADDIIMHIGYTVICRNNLPVEMIFIRQIQHPPEIQCGFSNRKNTRTIINGLDMHCIYLFKGEFVPMYLNLNKWLRAVLLNQRALKLC